MSQPASGTYVSLFVVDLEAAIAAWRGGAPAALAVPGGRLATALDAAEAPAALFDAFVEDRAVAHLYDAPLSALATALDSIGCAAKLHSLEIAGLEAAPSVYPAGVASKGGNGLVVWLDGAALGPAAEAAHGDLGAPPRSVDPDLWRDLVAALAEILDAAAKPGMRVIGHMD